MSRLDLVIFGATGFTGKYAVHEMIRLSKKYPDLTWGVAARSMSKLHTLMIDIAKKTGEDLSDVKMILADVNDEQSLEDMCRQTKVVANCCGPYLLYGEPVVKAAVRSKTHYVDVSGEPEFMETMQFRYNDESRENGVYVISACGFDSIPNDMGVIYLQQHFGGTLNSVESYLSISALQNSSTSIHYGTWASFVLGLANFGNLKTIRQKMYPKRLPTFKPKLERRSLVHKKDNSWCLPFPGPDDSTVYRTQRHLYEHYNLRPVQFKPYIKQPSLLSIIAVSFAVILLYLMSKTKFMRQLLLDHPRLFSCGVVSREGPSEEVMNATPFKFELHGEGWSKGVDVDSCRPDKRVVVQVSGTNPGYGATVTALLLSAITVLQEQDKMPTGGVLTTGVAFRNTELVKKLNENNVTFEILYDSSK